MERGLGTILWAIDENMGTNLQAVTSIYTSAVWKHKLHIFFKNNSGRALDNSAGRWIIGQGARQYGQGAAPSEICLAGTLGTTASSTPVDKNIKFNARAESSQPPTTMYLQFGQHAQ